MSDVRKYFLYVMMALVVLSGVVGPAMADDDEDDDNGGRSSSGRVKLKKDEIMISYVAAPTMGMPKGLDAIAFIPFSQAVEDKENIYSPREKRWGDEVIAAIAQRMQQTSNQFKIPLKLVEREAIVAIMKEKDLADAGLAEESKALKLGKLAHAQAICYGRVAINIRTVEGQGKTLHFAPTDDGIRIQPETARRLRRTVSVAATIKLVAISTGRSILVYNNRLAETKELKPRIVMGEDAQEIEFQPEEEVIERLITQIVDEFVGQLLPQEVHMVVKMAGVKSKLAKTAVKFLKSGDYEHSLEMFREAVEVKPDDHGAWYNLGLSYEAVGDLPSALKAYERASQIKDVGYYFDAIQRVKPRAIAMQGAPKGRNAAPVEGPAQAAPQGDGKVVEPEGELLPE